MTETSTPILYITGEYPSVTHTWILREIDALRGYGYDIRTSSARAPGPQHLVSEAHRTAAAGTFYILRALKSPGAFLRALARGATGRGLSALALAWRTAPTGIKGRLYNLIYWLEALALAEHMDRIGARHVHCHMPMQAGTQAMLAARIAGGSWSFTLHGPDIFYRPEHWALGTKVADASFGACISDFARSQAMFFSDPAHWDRLHIVHCGIEPDRYRPAAPGPGTRLLFVGRLSDVKGVGVLFDALGQALAEVPDLTLTLVGDGPNRAALERRAAAEGLPVTFLGYQSPEDVAGLLGRHDMLVLPSFAEGVPVVLMEAMAAGLPTIATRVGGVAELVDESTGLLLPPGNEEALARALVRLARDGDLRARMGRAGRERVVADFDSAREAARLGILLTAYTSGATRPARRPGS